MSKNQPVKNLPRPLDTNPTTDEDRYNSDPYGVTISLLQMQIGVLSQRLDAIDLPSSPREAGLFALESDGDGSLAWIEIGGGQDKDENDPE